MTTERYFIIKGSEDGGCRISIKTKEEIIKAMIPNEYGEVDMEPGKVLPHLPDDICNFTDFVIIKGTIVKPIAKKVVTEFDLP